MSLEASIKIYQTIDEFVQDVRSNKIDFPYIKYLYTDQQIRNFFEKIKNFDVEGHLAIRQYQIFNISPNICKCEYQNKPVVIIFDEMHHEKYGILSDIFQEYCRIRCIFSNNYFSPYQYFKKFPEKIAKFAVNKYNMITNKTIRESIWTLSKECNVFKSVLVVIFVKLFNAKSILDFSSGWGDRLIGAMASDVEYVGIDPNECLHPNYQKMIKFFGKSPKKYLLIRDRIETVKLPKRKYDLVFTSPPYFDLESYSKNDMYLDNEKDWFDKFLKIALKKCFDVLQKNGHMTININQKNRNQHYIEWMLKFMETLDNCQYLGVISYLTLKSSNPQPFFIWKKI